MLVKTIAANYELLVYARRAWTANNHYFSLHRREQIVMRRKSSISFQRMWTFSNWLGGPKAWASQFLQETHFVKSG